jgi:hypothetical protein
VTSRSGTDHRQWSSESAFFKGFFNLDHLDHLFKKRNKNKYTRKNTQDSFPANAGLGGPCGPQRLGVRSHSD